MQKGIIIDYEIDRMLISERIFGKLKELGMAQKEFSKRTGIRETTISEWKGKYVKSF